MCCVLYTRHIVPNHLKPAERAFLLSCKCENCILHFYWSSKSTAVQSISPREELPSSPAACCLLGRIIGPLPQMPHFCIFIGGISEENLFLAFLLPSPPSAVPNQICWWQILKATSSRQSRSNEVDSLCPDSHPPRRHTYTAHSEVSLIKPSAWIEPLAETHHLALINSLSPSVRGNPTFPFLLLLLGTRACRFQAEVPTVNVSSRLFKGIVVISAASPVRLITQKELYVSRNNRIDWAHSPKGVGLQQSALFNRWYRSDGTLQCDLYHAALWEMGHHSKSHSLSGRAGRSPWLCNLLNHTVDRHGRRHSACRAVPCSTFTPYVQRHFHLKKNPLIHMWAYVSAHNSPLHDFSLK